MNFNNKKIKKYTIIFTSVSVGLISILITSILLAVHFVNSKNNLGIAVVLIVVLWLLASALPFIIFIKPLIFKSIQQETLTNTKNERRFKIGLKIFFTCYISLLFCCAIFSIIYIATLEKNGFEEYLFYWISCIARVFDGIVGVSSNASAADIFVGIGLSAFLLGIPVCVYFIVDYFKTEKDKKFCEEFEREELEALEKKEIVKEEDTKAKPRWLR